MGGPGRQGHHDRRGNVIDRRGRSARSSGRPLRLQSFRYTPAAMDSKSEGGRCRPCNVTVTAEEGCIVACTAACLRQLSEE